MAANDLVTEGQVTALVAAVAAHVPVKVTSGPTPPASPAVGDVHFDTTSTLSGGSGSSVIDGGTWDTVYGGTTPIDGGTF